MDALLIVIVEFAGGLMVTLCVSLLNKYVVFAAGAENARSPGSIVVD